MTIYSTSQPLPIAVLISGYGSTLQAIIDAIILQSLPVRVVVVVSSNENAYGLIRAQQAGIPTEIISSKNYPDKQAYDHALCEVLANYQPKLICLAGFMRILGREFIQKFPQQIINIHPSLLPHYPGLNTYQQALSAGDKFHGTTVHVVTEELDSGPILAQVQTSIEPDDTIDTLKAKVQGLERQLYPKIIELIAKGRLQFHDNYVILDGQRLSQTGITTTFLESVSWSNQN
jgi:phosphoribosylglycinamide formyltransferase 1